MSKRHQQRNRAVYGFADWLEAWRAGRFLTAEQMQAEDDAWRYRCMGGAGQ